MPAAKKTKPVAKTPAKRRGPQTKPDGTPTARQTLDSVGEKTILDLFEYEGMGIKAAAKHLTKQTECTISGSQLHEWLNENPERSRAYARAREAAAEAYDDQALEELQNANKETIAVAREIAAHLRWRSRVANPKKYGDKLALDAEVKTSQIPDDQLAAELIKMGFLVKGFGNAGTA